MQYFSINNREALTLFNQIISTISFYHKTANFRAPIVLKLFSYTTVIFLLWESIHMRCDYLENHSTDDRCWIRCMLIQCKFKWWLNRFCEDNPYSIIYFDSVDFTIEYVNVLFLWVVSGILCLIALEVPNRNNTCCDLITKISTPFYLHAKAEILYQI